MKKLKVSGDPANSISLNPQAAGRYSFDFCKKGHIHREYSVWGFTCDSVFRIKNQKIQHYLEEELLTPYGGKSYKKAGKVVSASQFQAAMKNCKKIQTIEYKNTASVRKMLAKGKCKAANMN